MIPHSKPTLGEEEERALIATLRSGQIAEGAMVARFERELSKYIGVKGGVATNSGHSALHLALVALKIGTGDEVITSTYSSPALLNAVGYTGAETVLADIDEHDFNISPIEVRKKITTQTRAIITPHMFGLPADIDALLKLGIPIIEDCAQSIGASIGGKMVGSFGELAMYSFYATKMMTAADGGMVTANSSGYLDEMRDIKDCLGKTGYRLRYKYKMTDIQAAIGVCQLAKLSGFVQRRNEIAELYNQALSGLNIELPKARENTTHTYYRYVIMITQDTAEFKENMWQRGVICGNGVMEPLHRALDLNNKDFPNCERVYKSAVSLPIYPSLTDEEVRLISNNIKNI